MEYIIVWRSSLRNPFLETSDNGFIEIYSSFDEAKKDAETRKITEGKDSLYHDYQIYQVAID